MPDMNPRRLKQLADVIDATFLNGSFAEVSFTVVADSSGLLLSARLLRSALSPSPGWCSHPHAAAMAGPGTHAGMHPHCPKLGFLERGVEAPGSLETPNTNPLTTRKGVSGSQLKCLTIGCIHPKGGT